MQADVPAGRHERHKTAQGLGSGRGQDVVVVHQQDDPWTRTVGLDAFGQLLAHGGSQLLRLDRVGRVTAVQLLGHDTAQTTSRVVYREHDLVLGEPAREVGGDQPEQVRLARHVLQVRRLLFRVDDADGNALDALRDQFVDDVELNGRVTLVRPAELDFDPDPVSVGALVVPGGLRPTRA